MKGWQDHKVFCPLSDIYEFLKIKQQKQKKETDL